MASRPLYRVVDWEVHFETYESRRLTRACSWVAMPNKHDGKSYRRLTREADAAALYGAWSALAQVASKCPIRGTLADLDGPLDAHDLEDKTGLRAEVFQRTLEVVSGERIGWLERIESTAEIQSILDQIAAQRRGAPRRRPQIPADSANLPQIPADYPDSPADSRTPAGDNAPRGHARANRTVPDSTEPDHTTPAAGACELEARREEAWQLCLSVLGKKRRRPSYLTTDALDRQAEALPIPAEDAEVLRWYYALPPDEQDVDLRARFRDADRLAQNLFPAIERAHAYAKKIGRPEKNGAPAPREPEGWRTAFLAEFPGAEPPDTWPEFQRMGASVRTPVLARLRGGKP